MLRAARHTLPLCVPSVVCLLFVSCPCLCSMFRVRGMSVHTVSEMRTGEKSPPLAPIPEGETVCTSHTPVLCRPLRASIARGPELDSLPSDHYEPTSSLATLRVQKKGLLSCRPLRVRSLLVGSTERHLGTHCVRWSACVSCLSSAFTRVSLEEFRSSMILDERSPSSKVFHPNGRLPFVGWSCPESGDFLSPINLDESSPGLQSLPTLRAFSQKSHPAE